MRADSSGGYARPHMRREGAILGALGLSAALMLAGCGTSSLTVLIGRGGPSSSLVITSDSSAIAALQTRLTTVVFNDTGGDSVLAGDHHEGTEVCSYDVNHGGHTYNVAVYGAAPTSACDSTSQQQFVTAIL